MKRTPRLRHPAGDAGATPWTRLKGHTSSEEEIWEATPLIPPPTPPPKKAPQSTSDTHIPGPSVAKSLFSESEDLPGLSEPELEPTRFDDDAEKQTAVGFSDFIEVRRYDSDTDTPKTGGLAYPTKRNRRKHTDTEISNLILVNQVMSSDPDISPSSRKEAEKRKRKLQHLQDTLRRVHSPPPSDESDINNSTDFDDLKIKHQRAEDEIISKTYIFKHKGRLVRHSIKDLDITPPAPAPVGLPERHCSFCEINIALKDWRLHIQSVYHCLKFQIWKNRLAHCWMRNLSKVPHSRDGCQDCEKRGRDVQLRTPPGHDFERYVADAAAEEVASSSTQPSKSYRCDVCNLTLWSEDYYQRHIDGKKHQMKVRSTKQQTDQPARKPSKRPAPAATPSAEPPTKKKAANPITAPGERYCEVCDTFVKKASHNWSRHTKSRKHRTNIRDNWTTSNEAEPDPDVDPVVEASFATPGAENRPGKHFLLEFDRPTKYKLAEQISRRLFSCIECGIRFRRASHLQRHMQHNVELHRELRLGTVILDRRLMDLRRQLQNIQLGDEESDPIPVDDMEELPPLTYDDLNTDEDRLNWLRYEIRSRLITERDYIEKFAICDEFTAADLPHSHSHAYLVTKEKHLFKEIKEYFFTEFHVDIQDIQRPRDLIKACRYITKNDRQAVLFNVPMKHASTTWRAYLYAQTHRNINWGHDIPASVAPCDRAIFTDVVSEEIRRQEDTNIILRTDKNLLGWQSELLTIISSADYERVVYWVVDVVGHGGKSFMSQYLVRNGKGIIFNNFNHRDNAYLYEGEQIVVFDIPRDTSLEETSLQFVEDIKNGYCISQKYETKRKVFPIPVVVVFSNSYPIKERLSLDRWRVFNLLLLDTDQWVLERDTSYNQP